MARSRERFSPKIQNLVWAGATHLFTSQGAGTAAQVMVTAADTKDTIMRIRGELVAWVDAPSIPAKNCVVGIGAIVMPEGQSTTVVSSPVTDTSAPWLFYDFFTLGYEEMVTDVIALPALSVFREVLDSKAMRRCPPDTEIQFVMENITFSSALSVNVSIEGRFLLGN